MSRIILPKIYDDPHGNYPQHKGKYKLSYSQYSSFISSDYRSRYLSNYFMGIKDPGNIYAHYGGACGKYLEDRTVDEELLSEDDIAVLNTIHHPENSRFEVEIVVDRGDYVIQGYIDREIEIRPGVINLTDFKTGNIKTKVDYYTDKKYQQTTLYSYQREIEGMQIDYSGVILIGRAGRGTYNEPLYLTGAIKELPTPYTKKRAEDFLLEVDATVEMISDYYKLFLKLKR